MAATVNSRPLPRWRAIAWDMDGTLLDTEPIHRSAHAAQCQALGLDVSDERIEANVGLGDEDFYRQLFREAGRQDPGYERGMAMADEKEARLFAAYRAAPVPTRPGVERVWRAAARRGLPQCLVTASRRAAAALALGKIWRRRLPIRICDENVRRSKPMPDPYRLAALRLRIAPSQLLVFEDSPAGVRAATAAGCLVVGFAGLVPASRLVAAGAGWIVLNAGDILRPNGPAPAVDFVA